MKIENLRTEEKAGRLRVAATVTWEDGERPAYELYFETEEEFAESLSCNPHAFLVGCIVPAMHYGERRVAIDAEICPELRQGLITAMSWLRHWYYEPDRELVRIEAKTQPKIPMPRTAERAGFFFSGGIDSFATLRRNRLTFPLEHPGSIKDALLVYGLELDDLEAFGYVKDALSRVAEEIGITLIPVYTNVYLNYRNEDVHQQFSFWTEKFESAALSSVAHAFAKRLSMVSIAANDDIPNVEPDGTHPLLDPNYSSSNLRIKHTVIELSRVERTRLIAEWNVALQNLRTCNQYKRYRPGHLNCGQCEKCLRTMLPLLALGVLNRTQAFAANDVSANFVLKALKSLPGATGQAAYKELMTALAKRGRNDLSRAIKQAIARSRRKRWKAIARGLDTRYLGGAVRRLKLLVVR